MGDLSIVRLCMECDHYEQAGNGACGFYGLLRRLPIARRECLGMQWVKRADSTTFAPKNLVDRLREDGSDLCRMAADRIEQLQDELCEMDEVPM